LAAFVLKKSQGCSAGGPGSFAEYLITPADFVVHIPDSWSFEDASQLGMAPLTALQALYESLSGLPTPSAPTTDSTPILIYGASSSVGIFATQFAKLAGMRVFATASRNNFDMVKAFGADEVYDYKDSDVSSQIKKASNGQLKLAVDCISQAQSPQIVANALSDDGGHVAAVLPYDSVRTGVPVKFSLIYEWIGRVTI
jgi:NADPH:quinone reductase-like Zn-dependent oxidoreductase